MAPSNLPEHQAVYAKIRDMILFGKLAPGQAVTIHGLVDSTGAGMTPVREAIRRLDAEGALAIGRNRRITVPQLTQHTLDQIAHARVAIEPEMASRATTRMNDACFDVLRRCERKVEAALRALHIEAYLKSNYDFHFALYAQSNMSVLHDLAHSLWLRVGPSLRIVCARLRGANLPDYHAETLAALKVGSPEKVRRAMEEDIRQGMDQIRFTLES